MCLCLRVSKSAGFPLHPLKAHCSTGTEILADIQKCLPKNTCVHFPKCIPPGWLPRQDFAHSSPGYVIPNVFWELLVCQPLKVSGRSDEDLDTKMKVSWPDTPVGEGMVQALFSSALLWWWTLLDSPVLPCWRWQELFQRLCWLWDQSHWKSHFGT